MKKRFTDEEILADIEAVTNGIDPSAIERDAYFNDPANAEEIEKQQALMDRVIAEYKAKHKQGL